MPTAQRQVLCANCLRKQLDAGERATCEYCGCSPLPSYAYPKTSGFHPERCKCVVGGVVKPVVAGRPRLTPVPTLKLK
jgi:hypothetical protein